jgi:hypothetical protein
MVAKVATLYLVAVAGSLLATDRIVLPFLPQWSANSAIMSQQVVNRSMKSDRLPIRRVTPASGAKERLDAPIAPDGKIVDDCKPPAEIHGRCFA